MTVVTLKQNIFKDYPNRYWVETGTYEGDAVQKALDAGFEHCYSIELSDKYYQHAKDRFKDNPRVTIIHGDSALILYDVIKDLKGGITFWLDGHYSKGDTAIGEYCSPIIPELFQIKEHGSKNTIIIDDMRNWRKSGRCNCSLYPCGKIYGFNEYDIIAELFRININYNIEFIDGYTENDILIARP